MDCYRHPGTDAAATCVACRQPINLIFYFFTGRYVGRGITGRVQQPLPSPGRVSDVTAV
jgi:hypothetical protein